MLDRNAAAPAEIQPLWPMDEGAGPSSFAPQGFVVGIARDDVEAFAMRKDLTSSGFDASKIRVYSSGQILRDLRRIDSYSRVDDLALGDDLSLYTAYASEGKSAVWINVQGDVDTSRALNYLQKRQLVFFHE